MAFSDHLTDEKMDAAFAYFVNTDDEYARAKSEVERCKRDAERAEAYEVVCADGPSHVRKAIAETKPSVKAKWIEYQEAVYRFELIKARRETEARRIDVWRTWFSGKKQGVHI